MSPKSQTVLPPDQKDTTVPALRQAQGERVRSDHGEFVKSSEVRDSG